MITGRNVICLASVEWDLLTQGPQLMSRRLAEAGNRVLYVENTGSRSPALRDAGRVWSRFSAVGQSMTSGGYREVAERLYVVAPLVLPPFGGRIRRSMNRRLFTRPLKKLAARLHFDDPIFLVFLPTDTVLDLLEDLRSPQGSIYYYCLADFTALNRTEVEFESAERELCRMADSCWAQTEGLASRLRIHNSRSYWLPIGFDARSFDVLRSDAAPPHDPDLDRIESFEKPVIGYLGSLHSLKVDVELLVSMAKAHQEWQWVFVGPPQNDVSALAALPNVTMTGSKPHALLPYFLRRFQVGIIPYRTTTEFMQHSVPTKLLEYFEAGVPVVSTPVPSIVSNSPRELSLTAAEEPLAFCRAIEQALDDDRSSKAEARRRFAEGFDWGVLVERMFREDDDAASTAAVDRPR